MIIHRSMAWTDAGSRGYQLLIEDGKLSVGLIHFWPGNAIGIRGRASRCRSTSGSTWRSPTTARAGPAGLALYVDGRRASCEVIRDQLTKNITGGGNDHLTVGQRFRDRGFKNGLVDEIKVFDRALTPLEVAQLVDGNALAQALSRDPARLTGLATRRPVRLLPGHRRRRVQGPSGGAQGLAAKAQRAGRSGARDHGDEGDAAAPADLPPQARGLRRPGRARSSRARRPACRRLKAPGRATGSGWRGG